VFLRWLVGYLLPGSPRYATTTTYPSIPCTRMRCPADQPGGVLHAADDGQAVLRAITAP
jgi:hypothetical protein